MISDRDIAIRAIGKGRGPDTPIGEVMTQDVKYCFDDEDLEQVSWNMGNIQVRRLPVLNRQKRLVGIISLRRHCAQPGWRCDRRLAARDFAARRPAHHSGALKRRAIVKHCVGTAGQSPDATERKSKRAVGKKPAEWILGAQQVPGISKSTPSRAIKASLVEPMDAAVSRSVEAVAVGKGPKNQLLACAAEEELSRFATTDSATPS
jgi:CBS domain